MSLRRIAKLFAAQNANQLVVILQQLLLPPAFIHIYGTSLYGQWLALSAAIAYLSTFNYGLQTYTNMQMTIHYNRGELQECREVQSAGLRILLAAFFGAAVLLLLVFAVPLKPLLHLSISTLSAQMALYLLGMQIMAGMLFGFFSGSYMVFGEAHRGANFGNLNQLLGMGAIVGLVLLREPFPVIAAGQITVTLLMTALLSVDLARRCPDLKPTVMYWKKGSLGSILKPSSQYMLLASSGLLAYQVPILLINRLLGPEMVVAYTVTRTIYSMSRRLLYLVTNSLSAEITLIYGQRDWPRLHRLYALSERVILLLTPPITFGSMLATPLLLQIWLHKGLLFRPGICITLGLTVSILSIKEHKYQFQFSSNRVESIAWQTLFAYGLTSLLSIPLMYKFGIQGYLITALISETLQLFYLLHLNDQLFAGQATLDHKPVYQMLAVMAVCTVLFFWPILHIRSVPYLLQGVLATVTTLLLSAFCYWIFQVDELRTMLWSKLASRVPALAGKGGGA
jgi:O-antigen/teichoic acid export membrane protein